MEKWKKFEKSVLEYQKLFIPNGNVKYNDKILGKITETYRQVDISITAKIGNYEILIAIDCKDHKEPLDVKTIEEAKGLFEDIGVNKGVIISSKGFSKTALTRGKNCGLDLLTYYDPEFNNIEPIYKIPVLCDMHGVKSHSFNVEL
jgi:hypothetical protein